MKISVGALATLLLGSLATFATADEYADATKKWCQGLAVTTPTSSTVIVAGKNAKITVTRVPDAHPKSVTGLDLYAVDKKGNARYVQNVWAGNYTLNTKASITDQIPKNVKAGLYYYRVWISNQINGMHGPDCIKTSHTFKVTSAARQHVDGTISYAESLDDEDIYNPEHFKGCFDLTIDNPPAGASYKQGDHIRVTGHRETPSETEALMKVNMYKVVGNNAPEFVYTAWEGNEHFIDSISLKDHLMLSEGQHSPDASYFYTFEVSSDKAENGDTCSFQSNQFKISQ
ncbi:uncharacterized protein BYT42DRAFT_27734 [Radiomyces spectabilis]|uniref:uncharacterized protein n=1 Tax=Radiomyces spectabilis TaxID=64574 RepID=UPI00221E9675|nr:uncharacterized protein BYT42DRAFT_27734 [Radiomyces spectabilis]KAI8394014.1 hypothetical protein BYT42DRAFT_27734 [Radiomyces spectabilis]